MEILSAHLALVNPRFLCRDTSEQHSLVVPLESWAGGPANTSELKALQKFAGAEYDHLGPLYRFCNGLALHGDGLTLGLLVASTDELSAFMNDWKESLYLDEADQYPFQRTGIPFATVAQSGNYFVMHEGKVYYSNHDGGDDAVWGATIEEFLARVCRDPAKFLYDAGCYTRYFDGETDRQYIPAEFQHD